MSSHLDCALLSAKVYKEYFARIAGIEVLASADKNIIAFAGTDITQPIDVLRDLRILPFYSPQNGLVPIGFLAAARRLGYVVLDHIADNDLESVTLTGHSLGGACAAITASLVNRESPGDNKIREVVTFGCPRVGRLRALECPITQYKFGNDIVTNLPPWPMPRPGKLTRLGNQSKFGDWISDHSMMNYVGALR